MKTKTSGGDWRNFAVTVSARRIKSSVIKSAAQWIDLRGLKPFCEDRSTVSRTRRIRKSSSLSYSFAVMRIKEMPKAVIVKIRSPFLGTGTIKRDFHSSGAVPDSRALFRMLEL
jgi:hypothetical protein